MTSTQNPPHAARYPAGALAFPHRDLIGIGQLERHEILFLLDEAKQWVTLNRQATKHENVLSGLTVINAFFENSTRTLLSFEIAGKRLGADVVNMHAAQSSVKKGETLIDTAITLNAMRADAIVIRHASSGAVDLIDGKLEMAKKFGATHVCKPDDFPGLNMEITGGEGFDFALECIGNPVTIRATYDAARRGGTAVIVGVGRMEEKIEFNAFELFYADKTLRGSMYGSSNVRTFMPKLLRLWKAGKLDLEGMITKTYSIDEAPQAFEDMISGQNARGVIVYD